MLIDSDCRALLDNSAVARLNNKRAGCVAARIGYIRERCIREQCVREYTLAAHNFSNALCGEAVSKPGC